MLDFTNLVSAIQGAVNQAVDSVSRENINNLLQFFHPMENADADKTSDDGSSDTTAKVLTQVERMTPKSVKLEYPKMTHNGPVNHAVDVPLITLSPVPSLQISDVHVEMDLEVVEDNGVVMVGFPQSQLVTAQGSNNVTQGGKTTPNAKITINIKADQRPLGVTALVEGYNKALRAQLPN